jgi:uncharacterized cupredoxin-like copper-binding protein
MRLLDVRARGGGSIVDAEVPLNRNRVRRGGAMTAVASFALVMLAACGGGAGEELHEDVTRVPTMSDAAAQATRDDANAPAATPEAEGGTPVTADATPAADGETPAAAMSVDVVSYDIYFEPKELTIPANTDVTVILPNDGVTLHNFSIDELGIDVDIAPGATEETIINAPAGEYEFYCAVPGHKEAGMVGTLIVSEDAAAVPAGTPMAQASPAAATTAGAATDATPELEAATSAGATPIPPAEEVAAAGEAAAMSAEVVSYDIYFEPAEFSIPANTDVTVSLPNEGVTLHNFAIDALDISVDLTPGETEEVVINAPAGEYEYYCNVPGHKQAGMVGTLIVTDDGVAAAPAESGATQAEESTEQEAATPSAAASEDPAAGEAAAEAVEVVSYDIYFEPSELAIPADTDVTVTLPNDGVTLHNFSIDELGIDVDIAPGATEEAVINAPAGEYEYYCNVPGHKQAGMVGTLTVG